MQAACRLMHPLDQSRSQSRALNQSKDCKRPDSDHLEDATVLYPSSDEEAGPTSTSPDITSHDHPAKLGLSEYLPAPQWLQFSAVVFGSEANKRFMSLLYQRPESE
jgi:hypothetical protein